MLKINKMRMKKYIEQNTKDLSIYEFLQMVFIYKAIINGWDIKHISHNKFELSSRSKKINLEKYDTLIKPTKLSLNEFILEDLLNNKQLKSTNIDSVINQDLDSWKQIIPELIN